MQLMLDLKNPLTIPTGLSIPVGEALPLAVERIVREIRPEKIILFGSYANGNPTPYSDVDLLVIWETDIPRSKRYLAVSCLLQPRPFPVDIIVNRPSEIEQAIEQGNFFYKDVLDFGLVLYERE